MIYTVGGILVATLAIAGLFFGWQRVGRTSIWFTIAGWALLVVSMVLFAQTSGGRFAVAYCAISVSFISWLVILGKRKKRVGIQQHRLTRQPLKWRAALRRSLPQLFTFVMMVPVSGSVAALSTVAVTTNLPLEKVNSIAIGIFVMPLVWGALVLWYCQDSNHRRLYSGFLVMAVSSSLYIIS